MSHSDQTWANYPVFFWDLSVCCGLHVLSELLFKQIHTTASQAGLLAYYLTAFVAIFGIVRVGVPLYIYEDIDDHEFGYSPGAERVAELMLSYQVYNVLCSLLYKPLRTGILLLHHFAAIAVCCVSLAGYVHGYVNYGFGVVESSNLTLTFMDLFKMFPALMATFPTLYNALRAVFALHFFIVRIILAWPLTWRFHTKLYVLLTSPESSATTTDIAALSFFAFALDALIVLQHFWGWLIAKGVLKILGLRPSRKPKQDMEPEEKEDPLSKLQKAADKSLHHKETLTEHLIETMQTAEPHVEEDQPLESFPTPTLG